MMIAVKTQPDGKIMQGGGRITGWQRKTQHNYENGEECIGEGQLTILEFKYKHNLPDETYRRTIDNYDKNTQHDDVEYRLWGLVNCEGQVDLDRPISKIIYGEECIQEQ